MSHGWNTKGGVVNAATAVFGVLFALLRVIATPPIIPVFYYHTVQPHPKFWTQLGVLLIFNTLNLMWFVKIIQMATKPAKGSEKKKGT